MSRRKNFPAALLFSVSLFLCSCLGINADIVLNPDNSGTIILEYRISRFLESLGVQDGNALWLPLPVGRADFERSVQRLPGMKLLSFSSKHDERDLVNTVSLQFSGIEALLNFLDPGGEKAVYERTGSGTVSSGSNRLVLYLSGTESRDFASGSLADFFTAISEGYFVNVSLTLPVEGTLSAPPVSGIHINPQGKKPGFSLPLSAILNSEVPLSLDFRW